MKTVEARARGATALLMLLALAGCGGGYRGEVRELTSPFEMDNAQRLAALNAVAARAQRGERPRFALDEACGLRVSRRGAAPREQRHALRPGMFVGVSFDKEAQLFEVHLLDRAGPDAQRLGLLMRSSAWMPATQADLLVQLLIRDCRPAQAAEAGNGAQAGR